MKKQVLLVFSFFIASTAYSADLIVDAEGMGGAYTSIQSAIDAALSGDKILVFPRAVNYSGNLSINKSLEITSAIEGAYFAMHGSISINTDNTLPANSRISISNAHLISGGISFVYSAVAADVSIVGCKLSEGAIAFNTSGYNLNVASDSLLSGYVHCVRGRVVGNYIDAGVSGGNAVYIGADPAQAFDEYTYVVGNHLKGSSVSSPSAYSTVILWNSPDQFAYIANNFIERSVSTWQRGVQIASNRIGVALDNVIINNTITGNNTGEWSIYLSSFNSKNLVFNNLIEGVAIAYGIESSAIVANNVVGFNYISTNSIALGTGILDDGTNDTSGGNIIDTVTGLLLFGNAIDGGNPDPAYTDLDLSVNDVGCYGGSFSRANFDTMLVGFGSKITFMVAPRHVIIGQSISIDGQGFDR